MARRRSSYRPRRSYSRSRSSYRAPARRSRSRRSGGGQTLRLVLQQPSMARPRAPFGSFQPTALFGQGLYNPFMAPYMGEGAPWPQQGGPGVPGARMVINPVQAPADVPDGGGAGTVPKK